MVEKVQSFQGRKLVFVSTSQQVVGFSKEKGEKEGGQRAPHLGFIFKVEC